MVLLTMVLRYLCYLGGRVRVGIRTRIGAILYKIEFTSRWRQALVPLELIHRAQLGPG